MNTVLSSRFMLRNRDKLWPDGPLGSYADFTLSVVTTTSATKSQYFVSVLHWSLHQRKGDSGR